MLYVFSMVDGCIIFLNLFHTSLSLLMKKMGKHGPEISFERQTHCIIYVLL